MSTVPRTDAATALPAMTAAGSLAAGLMALGQFVRTPLEAGSSTWDLAFDQGGGSGALLLVLGSGAVLLALRGRHASAPGAAPAVALGFGALLLALATYLALAG